MIYLSLPALGRIESRVTLANLVVFQCLPMVITNIRKYENLNSMLAASFSLSPIPSSLPFLLSPFLPTQAKYIAKPKFGDVPGGEASLNLIL